MIMDIFYHYQESRKNSYVLNEDMYLQKSAKKFGFYVGYRYSDVGTWAAVQIFSVPICFAPVSEANCIQII
jgi:hypothetical protein